MSRGPSLMGAPITLADLILAGMAAVVVWHYVKPYVTVHAPEPYAALAAVPSEPLPDWLRTPAGATEPMRAARTTRGRSPRSEAEPSD